MSGLTGHIDHLYEDPNLSLEDIVKIYRRIAENSNEINIYEKVDGYNIYISYSTSDKKARLLRNNSQIKNGGITIDELKAEFTTNRIRSGKNPVPANVVSTYDTLIKFFETVVNSVFSTDEQKNLVFGNDQNNQPQFFFNCELLDPASPNVIKYDKKMLVFHKLGNVKIDANEGKIIETDTDEIKSKFEELKKIFGKTEKIEINEDKESKIDLVDLEKLDKELGVLRSHFKKLGLDMKSTIGEYLLKGIEDQLDSKKTNFDNFQREFITKSILSVGFGPKFIKKPRINQFFSTNKIQDSGEIKNYTNEEPAREIFKTLRAPLEKSIFNCSSILLDKYESRYITNNKQTAEDIISLVNSSIEHIKSNGNDKQKSNLTKQIDKLKNNVLSFGELVNNPVEGIVFSYNNHTYKITSSFGPVNQIVHMSKFEVQSLRENNDRNIISANGIKVLFAGSFKPPHRGHLEAIKNFIQLPNLSRKNFTVEKIIVIIGDRPRTSSIGEEFNLNQSMELFKLYLKSAGLEDLVELRITKRNNPVKDVYDFIANENDEEDKAQPGDVILLGASAKDKGYYSNLAKFVKDKPWQVLFGSEYEIPEFTSISSSSNFVMSSTDFRNAISKNNLKAIDTYLPKEVLSSPEYKNLAYKILGVEAEIQEIKENTLISMINKQITVKNTTKLNINELINRVNSIYIK
jgi:nicotinamide mononucleotide adenylyltransferase